MAPLLCNCTTPRRPATRTTHNCHSSALALGRSAATAVQDDLDAPLPDSGQTALKNACRKYGWKRLPAALIGCDSLLARCQREVTRRCPNVFRIARIRNRAQAAGAALAASRNRNLDLAVRLCGWEPSAEYCERLFAHAAQDVSLIESLDECPFGRALERTSTVHCVHGCEKCTSSAKVASSST